MLFFVEHTFSPPPDLKAEIDYYFWSTLGPSTPISLLHQTITPSLLLFAIKTSLKEGRMVVIMPRAQIFTLDEAMQKQRLVVEKDRFIFMVPRAGYFFKEGLDRIELNQYQDLEKLALSWGK